MKKIVDEDFFQIFKHIIGLMVDFAAPAVELAGLPEVPELDGVNLIPHLSGQKNYETGRQGTL